MGQPVILEAAYFDAVYELYRYAFHKEPRGGRDALAEFFKQTTVYGEFDDNNQLTSQVTRIPFSVRLGTGKLPVTVSAMWLVIPNTEVTGLHRG